MTSDVSTIRKITSLLTDSERHGLISLFGLILISMALEMIGVGLVIPVTAILIDPDAANRIPMLQPLSGIVGDLSQERAVIIGMSALVVVYVVKNIYLGVLAWRETRFISRLNVDLSQRLFTSYLSRPYTFHLQRNSAHLINSISVEVSTLTHVGLSAGLRFMAELVVLVGLAILLVVVEPVGTLVIGAAGLLAGWSYLWLTRSRIERWALARQHHDEMSFQHLQQGLGAAKDVLLLGRESEFLRQYLWHNTRRAAAGQRHEFVRQFPRLALEIFAVSALAFLTILMVAQGRPPASALPIVGMFAAAAFRILPSVNRILFSLQAIRYAAPSLDLLYQDLTLSPAPVRTSASRSDLRETIELRDVTFTYPATTEAALKNVSMEIQRGESIGIAGPSGAGKSTLIDVFLGLLEPDSGSVVVDRRDIRENLRTWQDQIGYVPQSIYLTDDTLRRNVAFGIAEDRIDDDALRAALRAAQLEEFAQSLPDGVDTVIGERGVRISGGERQRVGIARALYHDPTVLILDEATSSLDSHTEHGIISTVQDMRRSKTIIIVSHRLSTIEHCDRTYVVTRGRVVRKDREGNEVAVDGR